MGRTDGRGRLSASRHLVRSLTLVSLFVLLTAAPALAQFQTVARADDKSLALNPVWTRLADVFGEAGSVESVEFSYDGLRIVSGTKFDNTVILWRTSDGTELWRRTLDAEIERVAWNPDGSQVASVSEDRKLIVFNAETGATEHEATLGAGIDGLAWSHDGRLLAAGEEYSRSASGARQGLLRVFEMPAFREVMTLDLGETINEVDFSEDDQFVMAVGQQGKVRVWDTGTERLVLDIDEDVTVSDDNDLHHFIAGQFSPAGDMIAVGDTEGLLHVYAFPSGELVRRFDRSGHKIETVQWTPDGQYLATAGNDPYIRFFRTADIAGEGRVYTALQVHAGDQAEYIDFSRNGALLASAHQDGAIRLWILMGEDPTLNERRHREVRAEQDAADRAREEADSRQP
ncbi:MAG: PQQ-binding-like beta-propeller repeat protein [Bacteroidota bacterium]